MPLFVHSSSSSSTSLLQAVPIHNHLASSIPLARSQLLSYKVAPPVDRVSHAAEKQNAMIMIILLGRYSQVRFDAQSRCNDFKNRPQCKQNEHRACPYPKWGLLLTPFPCKDSIVAAAPDFCIDAIRSQIMNRGKLSVVTRGGVKVICISRC